MLDSSSVLLTMRGPPSPARAFSPSDCYVADELVVSRAGRRVRVGNTDAEGRMVMVDLLCEMKEQVRGGAEPESQRLRLRLFSVVTVTGVSAGGPRDFPRAVYHRDSNGSRHQSHGTKLLCESSRTNSNFLLSSHCS